MSHMLFDNSFSWSSEGSGIGCYTYIWFFLFHETSEGKKIRRGKKRHDGTRIVMMDMDKKNRCLNEVGGIYYMSS